MNLSIDSAIALLVNEVVNGLLEREDWQSAIKMPLGVVPAVSSALPPLSSTLDIGSSLPPITSSLPKPFGDLAPPKSTDQAPSESVTPGSRKSMLYNGGGNFVELLEDMDTSESEHSDCEVDDDVDWKYSSLDVGDKSGWAHAEAKGRRRKTKRKMSKPGRHSVAQSNSNYFDDPETMDTMPAVEQDKKLQKPLDVSCSCSKWSFCKTAKCECRVAGVIAVFHVAPRIKIFFLRFV